MELFRALGALAEPPGPEQIRLGEVLGLSGRPDPAEYTDLFLFQMYPYASVYVGAEGMMGGEGQDRIAGFWRAMRWPPPPEPDHLAVLLGLYATLHEQERAEPEAARGALWRQARKALLWEHLACWLFPYLVRLAQIAPPFYRAWADLLEEAVRRELSELGPPDALPLHLREAPPLPDPREEGLDAFLQGVLAPVRSGMIAVRADLAWAAREMGLGLRMGERRFILKSLFAQDAAGTLAWLGAEAQRWAAWHHEQERLLGGVATFWAKRAGAAAALLGELDAAAKLERGYPVEKERRAV